MALTTEPVRFWYSTSSTPPPRPRIDLIRTARLVPSSTESRIVTFRTQPLLSLPIETPCPAGTNQNHGNRTHTHTHTRARRMVRGREGGRGVGGG